MSHADAAVQAPAGLHLMAKPAGAACNLDCSYCFYLEKEQLYPARQSRLMDDAVLEAYVRQNIAAEPGPEVLFTWQGGEPMLRGLEFYQRAVALQQRHAGGKTVRNALQTNGLLLDEDWCRFLAQADFSVGISLDGPAAIHDRERFDKQGRPTHARVMAAIAQLRAHRIAFNVLVTVTRAVSEAPDAVYAFLRAHELHPIQFNPVVERLPDASEQQRGLHFAEPGARTAAATVEVSPSSVEPEAYGRFLTRVFDLWVRHDVGRIHVMNFEWALAGFMGLPASVCLFARDCGRALVVEHDGDVYSCDHFVYPAHRLGNLLQQPVQVLPESAQQRAFGAAKHATLPAECRQCDYLRACHGECPKNRFARAADGSVRLNYLCAGYKIYFGHLAPYLNAMARLIAAGQPASRITEVMQGPLAVPRNPVRAPATAPRVIPIQSIKEARP